MSIDSLDLKKLKEDVLEFIGNVMPFFPMSIKEVLAIEEAKPIEIVVIACNLGFDLSEYRYMKIR